jgi:hypothetical protein
LLSVGWRGTRFVFVLVLQRESHSRFACDRCIVQVIRCYDNRLRFTDRRPDVYVDSQAVNNYYFRLVDSTEPLAFGQRGVNQSNRPDWLWTFGGQLMVFSTPYIQGTHYATSPLHLLGLVVEVEKLHQRFMHGDIRCYNIVFRRENVVGVDRYDEKFDLQGHRAYLIDFDFGGRAGDPNLRYPEGYTKSLFDGLRSGIAGQAIVAPIEWTDVAYIVFRLHDLEPPEEVTDPEVNARLEKEQRRLRALFTKGPIPALVDALNGVRDMKKLLFQMHQQRWNVSLTRGFQTDLEKYGLLDDGNAEDAPRTATDHTSGSPRKATFKRSADDANL